MVLRLLIAVMAPPTMKVSSVPYVGLDTTNVALVPALRGIVVHFDAVLHGSMAYDPSPQGSSSAQEEDLIDLERNKVERYGIVEDTRNLGFMLAAMRY